MIGKVALRSASRSFRCCSPYTAYRPFSQSVRAAPPNADISTFRDQAFTPENPLFFPSNSPLVGELPAVSRWFSPAPQETLAGNDVGDDAATANTPFTLSPILDDHLDWPFPFELVVNQEEATSRPTGLAAFRNWLLQSQDFHDQILAGIVQSAVEESRDRTFFQLEAPLRLLQKALRFNQQQRRHGGPVDASPVQLYIAQSLLADLPPALLADLPTPEPVMHAGKGGRIWI